MEVLDSLLKQLSKLKNIVSNIKKLIIKAVVSIVFPLDRKINKTHKNLEKSIKNIKTELNGKKSIVLFIMICICKILGLMKRISNKNTIIIKSTILDIDESDNYIYSSTNHGYDDSVISFVNWKHIKYDSKEETIDVGDLAYDFKNSGEDEFLFNIYFDSNNNAKSNRKSEIPSNKKGKYLFCKEVIETIFNKEIGKEIKLDSGIEKKDDIKLGCELYKVKFYYGDNGFTVAVLYEFKNDNWKYTCSYKVVEGHNLLELYNFSILHEKDDFFKVLSQDKTKLILDNIRMYRIENAKINLSNIIMDIGKDIVTLVAIIGAITLLLSQLKNIILV